MSPRTARLLEGAANATVTAVEYLAYTVILFAICVFWIIT